MNPDPTSLERLHDIVAPPPVPWWPPAPAWYWVLCFTALLLVLALVRLFMRWQHNRYRREALAELDRQQSNLDHPDRRAAAVTAVAELLKRTALSVFPRENVASLTGPAWFNFLDRTAQTKSFSDGYGARLEHAAYDQRVANSLSESEARELVKQARSWIAYHRVNDLGAN